MGIFGDQSERLLRESWGSVNALAEELYAIFAMNLPLQISGPVEITNAKAGQPALTVTQWSGDLPPIAFRKPSGQGPGDYTTTGLQPGAGFDPAVPQDQAKPKPPPTPAAGNAVPGKILSGAGDVYTVEIYPDGRDALPQRVTVTQLDIDLLETIPPGVWAICVQTSDGQWWMQVPVWM